MLGQLGRGAFVVLSTRCTEWLLQMKRQKMTEQKTNNKYLDNDRIKIFTMICYSYLKNSFFKIEVEKFFIQNWPELVASLQFFN
jgi:hypothetical protein